MPDRFFPEPLLLKPPSWCPVTLCHSPCVVSHTLAPLVCDRGHPHSHALPSPSPTSYSLPPSLLPSLLSFSSLPPPDNEQLARSGTNCLENLSLAVGQTVSPDTWDKMVQCMRDIFTASIPHQVSHVCVL